MRCLNSCAKKNLIDRVGFKDLGAGGIACASVELAEASGYGAEINLDLVPTSMNNLLPAVVLCSETQERFMWVVPKELVETFLNHYNTRFALPEICDGAQATVVGKIRNDGLYVAKAQGKEIVSARAEDITKGILYDRPYSSKQHSHSEPQPIIVSDFNEELLSLLAHENIASRAPIYESYDKQVQGRSVVEPGWADAGVIAPFNEDKYPEEIQRTGVALSVDHNPRYNKIDAYWGAVNAVIESVRNIIAVGAWPLALTDCLCFGNPENSEQMGEFVDSVRGIVDACHAVKMFTDRSVSLPIISGNVSLYNESAQGAIPPSPIISCLGAMNDLSKTVTYDFKHPNSVLLMVGARKDECGGSVYYQLHNQLGSQLPKPDLAAFADEISAVHAAMQAGLVWSAHDISEGGIAVALAEMSFKNEIGVNVFISGDLPNDKKLFSESGGFILEVSPENISALEQIFQQYSVAFQTIGETTVTPTLIMNSVINLSISAAKTAWNNGLVERLI
ncbi:phosphoribosylformylglycinamidine synthase II (FGAM synthase II) [Legionella cherrii]|uniref:Phosphoribosylformylglycinamidine synthase subunit PurL n=2 Tax=Legionella cherrii TaxID=28084 RepID=A0ABY6T2D1_9GAMM|nr:phosphoribosylformylglycinamidine synthase II (FGAM synthase II) [Legionella cherrii]